MGKTTALQRLLTAVVGEHPIFGVGGESEVAVLQLNLSELPVREVSLLTNIICLHSMSHIEPYPVQGSQAMLKAMLKNIVSGMTTCGVSSWALDQAAMNLRTPGYTISGQDISMIFDKLDVPLLVLVGRRLLFPFCSVTVTQHLMIASLKFIFRCVP